MTAAEQDVAPEAGQQSWELSFSAIEIGGSAALGADVKLELEPRVTVLVGRNGAGKSLLLEKLHAGIEGVIGAVRTDEPDPARFACEVDLREAVESEPAGRILYECRWEPREAEETNDRAALGVTGDADAKVSETCWLRDEDEDEKQLLWRVDDGVVTYNTGERAKMKRRKGEIAAGRTLLNWTSSRRGRFLFPYMAYPLRELFWGVLRVPAGLPRGDGEREELALPYPESSKNRNLFEARRIRRLAYNLVRWHEDDRERFDELVALGRRTGLLDEIKVKLYRDPEPGPDARRRDLVSVLVDGTDLGLLSDGTLRTAEILMWLIMPGLTLLLIEEPETAVHPGLLSKLLAEIEAYSYDRQVVLSTQSPQVVSWAEPLALRLVERRSGRTEVRRLRDDEVARLSSYLHDEGTLGDFVYSGALDG